MHTDQSTFNNTVSPSFMQSGFKGGITESKEIHESVPTVSSVDGSIALTSNHIFHNKKQDIQQGSNTGISNSMHIANTATLPQDVIIGSMNTNKLDLVEDSLDWSIDFTEERIGSDLQNDITSEFVCRSNFDSIGNTTKDQVNLRYAQESPIQFDDANRDMTFDRKKFADSETPVSSHTTDSDNLEQAHNKEEGPIWIKVAAMKKNTSVSSLKNRTIVRRSLRDSGLGYIQDHKLVNQDSTDEFDESVLSINTNATRSYGTEVTKVTKTHKLSHQSKPSILKRTLVDNSCVDELALKMYNLDGYNVNDIAKTINGK